MVNFIMHVKVKSCSVFMVFTEFSRECFLLNSEMTASGVWQASEQLSQQYSCPSRKVWDAVEKTKEA